MKTFLLACLMLTGPLWADDTEGKEIWNPDGGNVYRLFRINRMTQAEAKDPDWWKIWIKKVEDAFTKLRDEARIAKLSRAELRARMNIFESGRKLLTHTLYYELHDTFFTAVDNKQLEVGDFKWPAVDEQFQGYLPKDGKPIKEGNPGVGLVHFALLNDFFNDQGPLPELSTSDAESAEASIRIHDAFDLFLKEHGITGFGKYCQTLKRTKEPNKVGFFTRAKDHFRVMHVAAFGAVTVITCAVGLLVYHHYTAPTPDQEVEAMNKARVAAQVKADRDAQNFGRELEREFSPRAP